MNGQHWTQQQLLLVSRDTLGGGSTRAAGQLNLGGGVACGLRDLFRALRKRFLAMRGFRLSCRYSHCLFLTYSIAGLEKRIEVERRSSIPEAHI